MAMMPTGLLHALWPVLPPSAQIWIRYNLPGVVGVSNMRLALVYFMIFDTRLILKRNSELWIHQKSVTFHLKVESFLWMI